MSSTLRNATEHTVHTLTDLVGDAMQHIELPHIELRHIELPHIELPHIELPHIDLARLARRRRSPSAAFVAAFIVAIGAAVLVVVVAVHAMRGRAATAGEGDAIIAPSEERHLDVG